MKNVLKIIILVLIINIVLTIFVDWHKENEIIEDNIVIETSIKQEEIIKEIEQENVVWEEEQNGYKVLAKLEIPKIKLKTNVLEECDSKSLLISVGKFWGAGPNEIGNFCIAGHNYYKRKNMFYNLRELKNGDKIYLTDKKNNCLEYQVYNVSKVQPQNVDCLSQNTNGGREITLITCTSDSKHRIIVKAKEI